MSMNVIVAASAVLLAATPAIAQDKAPAPAPTFAPSAENGGGSAAASPRTRYCFMTEQTGSRIATKQCRTREEWLALGVDPRDHMRK